MAWLPMNTAPKDRCVLVRRHNGVSHEHYVVWWNDSNPVYPWCADFTAYTHDRLDEWHEIPTAPLAVKFLEIEMEICNDCRKPIERGQTCYVSNPVPGTIHHYHSKCGDPFGIKAAVAAERERCAKIADKYAEHFKRSGPLSGAADVQWGAFAIAAAIRTDVDG